MSMSYMNVSVAMTGISSDLHSRISWFCCRSGIGYSNHRYPSSSSFGTYLLWWW